MSKFQILTALFAGTDGNVITVNGETGRLLSVERESGEGRSYNLRIRITEGIRQGKTINTFVRTVD